MYGKIVEILHRDLSDYLALSGFSVLTLGLSGGLDSALAAALAVNSVGKNNLQAYFLPYKSSSLQSREDAERISSHLGINLVEIDISLAADTLAVSLKQENIISFNNILSRIRMTVLFDRSAFHNALVLGTANKSELLLGFNTIFGDSACAVNPLGDLYKTQVKELASFLGLPKSIVDKPPSADYYEGQTDEGDIGYSYDQIDALLFDYIEKGTPKEELLRKYDSVMVDSILRRVSRNSYKRQLPKILTIGQNRIYIDN